MATIPRPTSRSYTDKDSGQVFQMYIDANTHALSLFNPDTQEEVKSFYCCAFTDCDVKMNTGEVIPLKTGEFIRQTTDRKVIARRFIIEKRFKKV